jgi:dihydroorotate dehydrogenase
VSDDALVPVTITPRSWRTLRRVLFQLDAEHAHRLAMRGLRLWSPFARAPRDDDVARVPGLAKEVMGLTFPNPVGLAAGMDKDAEAVPAWQALGFGFVEVGTVTWIPQPGNDKPRLFRLPADEALMNRMGFNNEGADLCARRLEKLRKRGRVSIPIGVNIGKSKVTPNDQAADDYALSFERVADVADYVAVNVSSPNTPGLRDLQAEDELKKILDGLMTLNDKRDERRPVLLKIAPDLDDEAARSCGRVAEELGLDGLIVSNTTISRDGLTPPIPEGSGGISGRPVFERSTELLRQLSAAHAGKLAMIGVGGILDAEDVRAKLDAGADLVQVYTGFVYGGPGFVRRLLYALASGAV